MLLMYLDPPRLYNGMRLVVKNSLPCVIEVTILIRNSVFIPQITPSGKECFSSQRRLYFPLRLFFAISINKSQGLHLGEPCFSHGQLYVGSKNTFRVCPKSQNEKYRLP